jgi:hypothetical protein
MCGIAATTSSVDVSPVVMSGVLVRTVGSAQLTATLTSTVSDSGQYRGVGTSLMAGDPILPRSIMDGEVDPLTRAE